MPVLADRLSPALRGLLRHKRFAALAVFSLGTAVGLNTTMYSVLDALLFPQWEMRQPERLYRMSFYGDYKGRVPDVQKLEAIQQAGVYSDTSRSVPLFGNNLVERGNQARPANVMLVAPNYFAFTGARALAGRLLSAVDSDVEPRSVVVSERLWRQLFPERERFDTATLVLNGEPRAIVGVWHSVRHQPQR